MAATPSVSSVNPPTSPAAPTTPPATSRPTVPTTKYLTGTITEGTLELTGPIADEATRQSLLDKIKSEAPDAKVIDKLVVVAGTKTPSPTAIGAIAGQLAAASGKRSFALSENGFTMGGEVTDALLEKWAPAMKSLAANRIKRGDTLWDFSPSVYHFPSRKVGEGLDPTVVGPLVEVLKANNIFFGSGRSDFKSDQRVKIANIIEAVKAVKGNVRFIIGGHADARGDPEYNQIISQERAKNVLDALKEGGLNTESFSLEAFGPSKIVNGPPESYAASRRVEVLVR
jgi:outer membrane protein OmpA-like peptidoglycan-associated protein